MLYTKEFAQEVSRLRQTMIWRDVATQTGRPVTTCWHALYRLRNEERAAGLRLANMTRLSKQQQIVRLEAIIATIRAEALRAPLGVMRSSTIIKLIGERE